jgi:DNA-binding winged helix-turn-helix (wHTH) protein
MRLRFGEFEFNSETGELWQGTTAIRVQPQPARVLALLISQPGELVTREALQQHIWGEDTVVDFEQGLNWCIRRLREVLDDIPSEPRFIQTVPRRGYRFVTDVKVLEPLEKRPLTASWWERRGRMQHSLDWDNVRRHGQSAATERHSTRSALRQSKHRKGRSPL